LERPNQSQHYVLLISLLFAIIGTFTFRGGAAALAWIVFFSLALATLGVVAIDKLRKITAAGRSPSSRQFAVLAAVIFLMALIGHYLVAGWPDPFSLLSSERSPYVASKWLFVLECLSLVCLSLACASMLSAWHTTQSASSRNDEMKKRWKLSPPIAVLAGIGTCAYFITQDMRFFVRGPADQIVVLQSSTQVPSTVYHGHYGGSLVNLVKIEWPEGKPAEWYSFNREPAAASRAARFVKELCTEYGQVMLCRGEPAAKKGRDGSIGDERHELLRRLESIPVIPREALTLAFWQDYWRAARERWDAVPVQWFTVGPEEARSFHLLDSGGPMTSIVFLSRRSERVRTQPVTEALFQSATNMSTFCIQYRELARGYAVNDHMYGMTVCAEPFAHEMFALYELDAERALPLFEAQLPYVDGGVAEDYDIFFGIEIEKRPEKFLRVFSQLPLELRERMAGFAATESRSKSELAKLREAMSRVSTDAERTFAKEISAMRARVEAAYPEVEY
jgi:hypothetical protein